MKKVLAKNFRPGDSDDICDPRRSSKHEKDARLVTLPKLFTDFSFTVGMDSPAIENLTSFWIPLRNVTLRDFLALNLILPNATSERIKSFQCISYYFLASGQ